MEYTHDELLTACRRELRAVQSYCERMSIKSDPDALGDYFKGFNAGLEFVTKQIDETLKYL